MAFNEGLKQKVDILGMLGLLQSKRNMENATKDEDANRLQRELMSQQVQAAKNANRESQLKYDLLTSPFNTQNFGRTGAESPYSMGYDKFASDRAAENKLGQMTGNFVPQAKLGGGGYGGGYGGGGEQQAAPSGMEYVGPDHSQAPSVVDAANNLGQVFRPDGGAAPSSPVTIQDLLAEEQMNKQGFQSLADQSGGKIPQSMVSDTAPITAAVADESKAKQYDEINKAKEAELKEKTSIEQKLYGNKTWNDPNFGISKTIKDKILADLPRIISNSKKIGISIDINQLISDYVNKYGKK